MVMPAADILDYDAQIRAAAAEGLVQRTWLSRQMGQSFDGRRDLYAILGYNRELTLEEIRERYERGGIAGVVVDAMPNATWRGGVELVEDAATEDYTAFEQDWLNLDQQHEIVAKLLKVDILSRISSFGVLLLGATGTLNTPLPQGTPGGLLYVKQYCGNYVPRIAMTGRRGIVSTTVAEALSTRGSADCVVSTWDLNPQSPRFGQPETYEIGRTALTPEMQTQIVHWTRIIHVADGLDDDVYGPSALEKPWNLFDDLIKVTGGGSEAFFQRANQGRNIKVDKDIKLLDENLKKSIRDQLELLELGYGKNIFTRGTDITTFGSDVANFNGPADAIITQIAGTSRLPKRIFVGSEAGDLASSQDRENWKDQVNGRRQEYAGPKMLRRLADRLIQFGYLTTPKKYEVRWGTILNFTEEEKLAGLSAWVLAKTDEGQVFTNDEIRAQWAGKEPLTDEQIAKIREAIAENNKLKTPPTPVQPQPQPFAPELA